MISYRKKIYTYNNGAVAGAFLGLDSELDEEESSETDLECGGGGRGGEGAQRKQARMAATTSPLLDSPGRRKRDGILGMIFR